MRKGFIGVTILVGVTAIAIGWLGWFSAQKAFQLEKQNVEAEINKLLGGSLASSTALTDTIGTFRINVNGSLDRLDAKITDTTSSDPGHKHSLNSSGLIATTSLGVAFGGLGSTSTPAVNQVVVGTSSIYGLTNAIPNCDTATSSKLLYASTSQQWSCGTDFSISTSTSDWQQIGETTLGVTNASASVAIVARKHLRVHISASTTGSGTLFLRFNNDQSANYANRNSANNGADTATNGDNIISLTASLGAASTTYSVVDIDNASNRNKKVMVLTTIDNRTTAPSSFQNYAVWATTTQITTIAAGNDTNSFGSSTVVTIYASSD